MRQPTATNGGRRGPAPSRRVLIIGAGRGQVGLIRAVQRLGATAVVATRRNAHLPGLAEADEILEVDLLATDEVVARACAARVDAVAACCMDTGLEALGAVVDDLGLRGISRDAARLCIDKLDMKRRLAAAGVPTAEFVAVRNRHEVAAALKVTGLPAVVKATDRQGSAGVLRVHTVDEARAAFDHAARASRSGRVIVERFLQGREFGAQALMHDGQLLHVTLHGDDLAPGLTPVPVGHHAPIAAEAAVRRRSLDVVAQAVAALGLDNCAVNLDLMASHDDVHVIELTGRAGANGLPEIIGAHHGLDYYEVIAREALDLAVAQTWAARKPWPGVVLAHMIVDPAARGVVTRVRRPAAVPDWVTDLRLFVAAGDVLRGFRSSADCIGQVVVRGADLAECRERARGVADQIIVETGG
ncbi:MAG: ATP-grasp domain-containing protein [Propionibacteriaceae bacterium]|nr:ATP-grasp domain-containing protein [Propionibacteriaceae bacterium]